jgi:hypothetical protein
MLVFSKYVASDFASIKGADACLLQIRIPIATGNQWHSCNSSQVDNTTADGPANEQGRPSFKSMQS